MLSLYSACDYLLKLGLTLILIVKGDKGHLHKTKKITILDAEQMKCYREYKGWSYS